MGTTGAHERDCEGPPPALKWGFPLQTSLRPPSLAWRWKGTRKEEVHRGQKRWSWRDEGSREVALVGLMPRKTGAGGRGCVSVAPVLGHWQSWPLPGFQELLRSKRREAGREGGKLDRLAHTRQMFAQKNTVKSSCKCNREPASHPAGFPARQLSVRRGRGLGLGRSALHDHASPSPPFPRRTVFFFANVTPSLGSAHPRGDNAKCSADPLPAPCSPPSIWGSVSHPRDGTPPAVQVSVPPPLASVYPHPSVSCCPKKLKKVTSQELGSPGRDREEQRRLPHAEGQGS